MRKHFDFYGYNSPTSGRYFVDDEVYTLGEDFRTPKRYREYKNVGFNIVLLQHENEYNGEDFSRSACKKCMDNAYKGGLDKVIVSDGRLKELCTLDCLVGENGRFSSYDELYKFVDDCTKPYRDHPGFYGVQLFDEPKFDYLDSYAEVYKAVKKVIPTANPQCNLLNLCAPNRLAINPGDKHQDYVDYLEHFLEKSGIDYLLTDEYAFRRNNTISEYTLPTYQILAYVCKKHNVELRLVMQAFSQQGSVVDNGELDGGISWRRITEKDMYWQMNLAMGFGCKEFSFFTYMTKPFLHFRGRSSVTDGVDGACFINYDGSRTKLYGYTKKIIAEMKKFESVLLKYNFVNSYLFFEKGKNKEDFFHTRNAFVKGECPIKVNISKGVAIVCELTDGKGNSMYMVENIRNTIDSIRDKCRASDVEIYLNGKEKNATYYYKGEQISLQANGGVVNYKLNCGQALFIEVRK